MLRIEENCLPLAAFTPRILRESPVALLAVDGNVFDMKSFQSLDGYDQVFSALPCYLCDFTVLTVTLFHNRRGGCPRKTWLSVV